MKRGAGAALVLLASCQPRYATAADCDALVDRFAELVVAEQAPDASADVLAKERARQREAARADEGFRACPRQVTREKHACAMAARTSEALLACLE